MDIEAIEGFLAEHFPQALVDGAKIERLDERGLVLGQEATEAHLRPGGTVSGPTLMTMADAAAYYVILARVGPKALAVTSSLQIHFLRKALPGRIRAQASILKLGRTLGVVEVELTTGERTDLVAKATVTYAIPS